MNYLIYSLNQIIDKLYNFLFWQDKLIKFDMKYKKKVSLNKYKMNI